MDEIRNILLPGQFNFDEAFRLFCTYSRSESLVRFIARKKCEKTLKYQLEKLLGQNAKPNPHASRFAQYMAVAPTSTPTVSAGGKLPEIIDFTRHEKIDRNKLPDLLREMYDKNTQAYKEMRSLHEKMKIVQTDEARKECRNTLIERSREVSERWKLLDGELAKLKEGGVDTTANGWKESTCRAYISKKLAKNEISDKDKIALQERVKQLQDRELPLNEKTIAKLKELKVI